MKKLAVIAGIFALLGWIAYWLHTSHIPSDTKIQNLEGDRIITLGHGGMGTRSWHTLNSSTSFQKALETGADGTEMDVQLTADGILVAFHDEFAGEAKCPSHISQHSYAELKDCLGSLLTVQEVLDLDWRTGSVFSLDVKLHGSDIAHQQLLAERIKDVKGNHPEFRILAESNSTAFLELLKEKGLLEGLYLYANDPESGLKSCIDSGFEGISIRSSQISAEQVKRFHSEGKRVMLWGVGTRWDNREAVLKGPDIIQSDRLQHLVSLLD